jgi:hypothetical protein
MTLLTWIVKRKFGALHNKLTIKEKWRQLASLEGPVFRQPRTKTGLTNDKSSG